MLFDLLNQFTIILTGNSFIVSHINHADCPVTKVEVKDETCTSILTNSHIEVDSVSPYGIKAKNIIPNGYYEKVCVEYTMTPLDTA